MFLGWWTVLSVVSTVMVVEGAYINPVQDPYAQLLSCSNFGILAGENMDKACTNYCAPNATEAFDYADSTEDPQYVVRNTVCRCFESSNTQADKSFECWSKAEVWDKQTPIMKCDDTALNITSQSACEEFCKSIDPIAYGYVTEGGKSRCSCQDIMVCDDIGGAAGGMAATATAFTLLFGAVAMFW
jgi:hypothetical protein